MASADPIYAQLAVLKAQDASLAGLAQREADSLIRTLHLSHPMTLPAAVHAVCQSSGYVMSEEVAAIALALHDKLNGSCQGRRPD